MDKPTVFISHITEEGEAARHLKELIENKFLNYVKVFASSHQESIKLGEDWLAAIKTSLTNCGLMVVICSPISITRPWINFEAGAGWVRGIQVVPLCHSGLTPGQLPTPLNALQGGMLGNQSDIQKLFQVLAGLLDIDSPDLMGDEFFELIHIFETNTRANVLLKDTRFIANMLVHYVGILEYCIYASTKDYNFLNTLDTSQACLEDCNFTFNDIYHLYNITVLFSGSQKVYKAIQNAVLQISDNIRFIHSNSHLKIAPELEELLNTFLYALPLVDKWAYAIELADQEPPGPARVRDFHIKMIKNEPLPPTRRPHNTINKFIDYYDGLVFYKKWIIKYKDTVNRLTGMQSTSE